MELALETRKRFAVANSHVLSTPSAGDHLQAADLRRRFSSALHRPTPVCFTYNCHGLTFASRRTEITSSAQVRQILTDDDYSLIAEKDVIAGDIVIYIDQSGDIEHSGIVMDVDRTVFVQIPKVLSKWGSANEAIHFVRDCPYASARIEYYRVIK